MRGATRGHRGRAERVEHRDGVSARIRLDLSIRLGLGQSTEWRDHIVFPCWRRSEAKGRLYTFANSEDVEVRVEERGIDVRRVEWVCRSKCD
jgi:hypothetical protein